MSERTSVYGKVVGVVPRETAHTGINKMDGKGNDKSEGSRTSY